MDYAPRQAHTATPAHGRRQVDHNIPPSRAEHDPPIRSPAKQIQALQRNCKDFGIGCSTWIAGPGDCACHRPRNWGDAAGHDHRVRRSPPARMELRLSGVWLGTSEVEHVRATQCLPQRKPKTMKIEVSGRLAEGVTAKDLALVIG